MPDLALWLCGAFAVGLFVYDFAYQRGQQAGRVAGYQRGHADGVQSVTPPAVEITHYVSAGWTTHGGRPGALAGTTGPGWAALVLEPEA